MGRDRKLGRKYQGCAEDGFSREQISDLMRRGAEGQKKPGKMAGPVGQGTMSLEGRL